MIPARLFADPALGGANWVGFVIGAAYFGCLFLLSLYLQQGLCMTPLHTGLSLLPLALCLTAGNVIAGRLLPRLARGARSPPAWRWPRWATCCARWPPCMAAWLPCWRQCCRWRPARPRRSRR